MRNSIRFAIVTLILVCGCTKKTNLIIPTRDVDYRNKSEMTLKGKLVCKDVLGAERMMISDTLLMIACNNPEGQLQVYSTNSNRLIGSFCTRGRAGSEFLRLYSTTEQRYHDENNHVIVPFVDYMTTIKEVDVTESLNQGHAVIRNTAEIIPFVDALTVFIDNDLDNRFLYEHAVTYEHQEDYGMVHDIDLTRVPTRISTQKTGSEMEEIPLFRRQVDVDDEREIVMPYAASIQKHPQRNLILYECINMDYLLFLDLDDFEKSFAIHQKGSKTFDDTFHDYGPVFLGCATSSDYLFVLYYQGDYTLRNMESDLMLPELMVFDWSGNLVKSFRMDMESFGLAYDEIHHKLYCLNDKEDLYVYDLNGLLQ